MLSQPNMPYQDTHNNSLQVSSINQLTQHSLGDNNNMMLDPINLAPNQNGGGDNTGLGAVLDT